MPTRHGSPAPPHGAAPDFDRKLEDQQRGPAKTTSDLPNDLVREVKLRAVSEGMKLKDEISDQLRKGLGQPNPMPAGTTARRGAVALPLFPSSPQAPARRMSLDTLVAAEPETLTRDDLERLRPPV